MSAPLILSNIALWLLVGFQTLILLGVLRAIHELRQRPQQRGRPVPDFRAADLAGRAFSTATLTGRPTVVLFVSPTCQSCMLTLDELKALTSDPTRGLFIVCRAEEADCHRLADVYQLSAPVIPDERAELMTLFGVSGLPTAVRIGADGVIESHGAPARGKELEELLAELTRTEEPVEQEALRADHRRGDVLSSDGRGTP